MLEYVLPSLQNGSRLICSKLSRHVGPMHRAELYNSMGDPTSIMLPLYEGRSCMPPGFNYTSTCEMGGYPSYAVNVSNVAQIQLAVNFARNLNLRLVVKNTGHDFAGKASGKGALSIWTHWLKGKAYYHSFKAANGYVGPAIKFGSGIQVWEANAYAKSVGASVVSGEAVTVGLGGGYTAGGGHSPLSSMFGLAADQVLAMEGCTFRSLRILRASS
jgi:FAD/FMN-containing dehydrogenase